MVENIDMKKYLLIITILGIGLVGCAGRVLFAEDEDLTHLLNWGSSSGIAVLAGMILALKEHTVSS